MNFGEKLTQLINDHAHTGTPWIIEDLMPYDWHITEVSDELIETGRWDVLHEAIYKHDGRFWMVHYSEPATENQDWDSYGTTVHEVEPYEVTVTQYRRIKK